MKRRSIVALGLIAVLAAALAAATSGATKKTTANSITVWLQTDAQNGWPDLVAAANQQFQAAHPGTTVNVQYQNWGDHLQKFDATLAGGGGPDVIEMGNTEMTKYMAAGAFADLLDKTHVRQLVELARRVSRRRAGTAARRTACPYYAGSRVVTYRKDLFKQAGHHEAAGDDGRVHRRREEAAGEEPAEGLLAGLHRRHRLVRRDGLRLRLRRRDRDAGERQVEGPARLAELDRRV